MLFYHPYGGHSEYSQGWLVQAGCAYAASTAGTALVVTHLQESCLAAHVPTIMTVQPLRRVVPSLQNNH